MQMLVGFNPSPGLNVFQTWPPPQVLEPTQWFQSLTWVERLSDQYDLMRHLTKLKSFNPSPGLNVFQTLDGHRSSRKMREFQSLTWVERLSDL